MASSTLLTVGCDHNFSAVAQARGKILCRILISSTTSPHMQASPPCTKETEVSGMYSVPYLRKRGSSAAQSQGSHEGRIYKTSPNRPRLKGDQDTNKLTTERGGYRGLSKIISF